MKTKILVIAALALGLSACNNRPTISDVYGKWEALSIYQGDTTIFDACDAPHRIITFTADTLVDFTGQEVLKCKIVNTFTKEGKTVIVLEHESNMGDTIAYEIVAPHLVEWYLYNEITFLTTNQPENYRTAQEICNEDLDEMSWYGHYRVEDDEWKLPGPLWNIQSLYIIIEDFEHVTVVFSRDGKEVVRKTKAIWDTEEKIEIEYSDEQTIFIQKYDGKDYLTGNVYAFDPSQREIPLVKEKQSSTTQNQTHDCDAPYREMLLKSRDQKKDFKLKIAFCDEDMKTGYVLYDGQTEHIPIQFDRSETVEKREEGRPDVRQLFYIEIYRGETNGVYVLTIQGARFYGAYYIRKKDNKKMELEVVNDNLEPV